MSEADKKRRQQAAAARDAATAGEKRRERTVRIVGAVTVAVVVVGIIGIAVFASQSSKEPTTTDIPVADASAALPAGVLGPDEDLAYGVPYGSAAADAPVLALWEDFQCPACGSLEKANGDGIARLAEEGKVKLVWRPTTFLDGNLGNDASVRAVAAWGCAIDAGKTREFHDYVYANQPATEGEGWTNEQLIEFGGAAGITGADLDTFTSCVNDGTYLTWASNSTSEFYGDNIQGTPHALLNGVEVPIGTVADAAALEKYIADSAAGAAPAASPSAS